MEPDLLSGLTAGERLDVWMLLLDEQQAREPDAGPVSWEGPDAVRVYFEFAWRQFGVTPEIIRSLADELHVDLASLIRRYRSR